jgi:hypothetical protein
MPLFPNSFSLVRIRRSVPVSLTSQAQRPHGNVQGELPDRSAPHILNMLGNDLESLEVLYRFYYPYVLR